MNKKLVKALTLLLSAAMLLSACGGTSSSSSSTPNASSSPTNSQGEGASTPAQVPAQQLTIGTASAGGAFYPVGTGVAEIITQYAKPITVTAEITGGSVENPRLVGNGESDLGLSNADHVTFAINGTEPFDKKYEVEAVCSLHESILHIVTLEGTGINSIEDLKGQKIAVGPSGGASIPALTAVLKAYGMSFDDIIPSYLSYDDGMSQLKDGQVKVALAQAGFPAAAVMSLATNSKVKMLTIPDDKMAEISAANPFYTKVLLPGSTYDTAEDVTVLSVRNLIYASPKLSVDTVYAITKALYENLEELKSYHNSLAGVEKATMCDVSGVKLHPGAEKYFKEIGAL